MFFRFPSDSLLAAVAPYSGFERDLLEFHRSKWLGNLLQVC